jgi:hypothetical protein
MYGRTYGLGAVEWRDGVPVDTNCPGRQPIRFTAGGVPIWGMTSSSGFAARPITNPDQIPCGQKQVDIRVTSVGKAVGKLPAAAAIAVGAVTVAALGSAVLAKGAGALSGAAGGGSAAAGAAGTAGSAGSLTATGGGLFGSIKATANKVIGYVNQGRTVSAIVNGEIPPPPVSLVGSSFTEWAFNVAKEELMKSHQRKLTRQEEEMLRLEIEAMQNDMARRVPENFPKQPDPAIPAPVQQRQIEIVEQNKGNADLINKALMFGIPIFAILALKG